MDKKQVLAGIAYLVSKKVVKADDEEIKEVPMDDQIDLSPESEPEAVDESEQELPEIEMPIVLENPIVAPEDMPSMEEMDEQIEEVQKNMEKESGPAMEDEKSHSLNDAAANFLDAVSIPKGGASQERMGSYDVLVLGQGVALDRAQIRHLLAEGLVHIAADGKSGGQALVFPAGSRF